MKLQNEHRDIIRQIHSLALSTGPNLTVMAGISVLSDYVFHNVSAFRGDEQVYSSSAMIGEKGQVEDHHETLEQQRDTLATLIAEARREVAA